MKYKGRWLERKFEELRQEFGGKCKKCNVVEELEFAHKEPTKIKGWGRGKERRYYDIINNKKSYVLLCKPCHKKFDKEEFTI